MSKSKLRSVIVLAMATLCLTAIAFPAQAAGKTKKNQPAKVKPAKVQPAKDNLVSVPSKPGDAFKDCADCPVMVAVPQGVFDMGSSVSDEKDERPSRRITFDQPFAMGKLEITRGQFAAFVSATGYNAGNKCMRFEDGKWEENNGGNWRNPGYSQDDNHPVACVSWNDAQAYVEWLTGQTGKQYRLPTESQWEYACRAGGKNDPDETEDQGKQYEYCGSDQLDSVAWYDQNSGKATHRAAAKQPNAFGLFDMSGNVGEWVEDSYHDHYNGVPGDGSAWTGDKSKRVLRGGSWIYSQTRMRTAFRSVSAPEYRYFDTGFRVVRALPEIKVEKPAEDN